MTTHDYRVMTLNELRKYVLRHREDIEAFEIYVDRAQQEGQIVKVLPISDVEIKLDPPATKIADFHHPKEQDYRMEDPEADLDVEFQDGSKTSIKAFLLRIYPETFNTYDAYLDIPLSLDGNKISRDIVKVHSNKLNQTWIVTDGPWESPINGVFRGDHSTNNPPVWCMGLKSE